MSEKLEESKYYKDVQVNRDGKTFTQRRLVGSDKQPMKSKFFNLHTLKDEFFNTDTEDGQRHKTSSLDYDKTPKDKRSESQKIKDDEELLKNRTDISDKKKEKLLSLQETTHRKNNSDDVFQEREERVKQLFNGKENFSDLTYREFFDKIKEVTGKPIFKKETMDMKIEVTSNSGKTHQRTFNDLSNHIKFRVDSIHKNDKVPFSNIKIIK